MSQMAQSIKSVIIYATTFKMRNFQHFVLSTLLKINGSIPCSPLEGQVHPIINSAMKVSFFFL